MRVVVVVSTFLRILVGFTVYDDLFYSFYYSLLVLIHELFLIHDQITDFPWDHNDIGSVLRIAFCSPQFRDVIVRDGTNQVFDEKTIFESIGIWNGSSSAEARGKQRKVIYGMYRKVCNNNLAHNYFPENQYKARIIPQSLSSILPKMMKYFETFGELYTISGDSSK